MPAEQRYCCKCGRTLNSSEFYQSNNKEKYPDGYLDQCKKCISMHVDNWNPDTFLWILQEADAPWIPDEWNKLMAKYAMDPSKVTGMTILGRYLSKMRLKQHKDYRWKDTKFLQELANAKVEQAMKAQGYGAAEIAQAINKQSFEVPDKPLLEPPAPNLGTGIGINAAVPAYRPDESDLEDLDLTDEDRTYLRLKWGKTYRPDEWVKLEQLYNEMMESYDIQAAGHIDTLKMICKASLKANQLLDIGDVDGAQKMLKVYDMLMKSGKFTAAQNKAESGEYVDSFSELVEVCERDGFIPKFYVDKPNDRVDETLLDLKNYTHTLVTEEMNLGNLIEHAIREMAKEESKEEDEDTDDELSFEDIDVLKDEDFADFSEFQDDEVEADETLLKSLSEEDDV